MRILIVDDDPIARDILANALTSMGHEVVVAEHGQQAISRLCDGSFRCIISDWEMPVMSGVELCRAVRARASSSYTYFILLTSRDRSEDIIEGLSSGADDFLIKPFRPSELKVRLQGAQRLLSLESRNVTIFALAKLAEHRDPDTGAHLERMREYARILAAQVAQQAQYRGVIDVEFIQLIHLTAPLHDIGKVGVPDRILQKPGPLDPAERSIMQTHVEIGAETLSAAAREFPDAKYLQMACELARSHHERYDGSGYPAGLIGEEIPLCARIAAVADVYDALTSDRVYRTAMTHQEACELIVPNAGAQFDPDVVQAFVEAEQQILIIRNRYHDIESPPQLDAVPLDLAAPVTPSGVET